MRIIFYPIAFSFLLVSCGGESVTNTEGSDSTAVDTTAVVNANIDIDVTSMLSRFSVSSPAPFVQDTNYLEAIEPNEDDRLSADEVKYLSYNFIESDISYNGMSTIEDVLFFDSLRTNDEYEGYVEVIDIGMMQTADAYVVQKVVLNETTTLLLWYVDFSTYEACPYLAGRTLYASVFQNNEVKSCALIGEDSGGGDAPYWGETISTSNVDAGKTTVSKISRSGGEEDEDGNDMVSESFTTYEMTIDESGMWVVVCLTPDVF